MKRTPIPAPPPGDAYIKLRARIELDDQKTPVFLVEIHEAAKGIWHPVRLFDGESIDFTIYFP